LDTIVEEDDEDDISDDYVDEKNSKKKIIKKKISKKKINKKKIIKKKNSKKKNSKEISNICNALTAQKHQCSRKHINNSKFCKVHTKQRKFGEVD